MQWSDFDGNRCVGTVRERAAVVFSSDVKFDGVFVVKNTKDWFSQEQEAWHKIEGFCASLKSMQG